MFKLCIGVCKKVEKPNLKPKPEKLDKCYIPIGIFYWLGFNFRINLYYFAVYAHISPIALDLGFFEF